MNIYRYLLIVAVFSIVSAFSYKAFSDDEIPFYVSRTGEGHVEFWVNCGGPWFRASNTALIKAGDKDKLLYSAKVTKAFSPYGHWNCGSQVLDGHESGNCPCCNPNSPCQVNFCLQKGDDAVYLDVTEDALTANISDNCDTSTTLAALGDDNSKPKRDRDTWSIQGTEGETVILTLEEDNEAGHTGEQATLILRSGGSDIESRTDALPIEITTTLPSDGEYQLVVQQQGVPEEARFRGYYYLSVKSDTGEIQEIKPSTDVEQ